VVFSAVIGFSAGAASAYSEDDLAPPASRNGVDAAAPVRMAPDAILIAGGADGSAQIRRISGDTGGEDRIELSGLAPDSETTDSGVDTAEFEAVLSLDAELNLSGLGAGQILTSGTQGVALISVHGSNANSLALVSSHELALDEFASGGREIDDREFKSNLAFDALSAAELTIGAPDQGAQSLVRAVAAASQIGDDSDTQWRERTSLLREAMAAGDPALLSAVWNKLSTDNAESGQSGFQGVFSKSFDADISFGSETFSFKGTTAGADRLWRGVFGKDDAVAAGLLGGFFEAGSDYGPGLERADYQGGQVGLYATYLGAGFFADANLKASFFDANAGSLNERSNRLASVAAFEAQVDLGYRFDQGAWFIEPVATLAYAKTDLAKKSVEPGQRVEFASSESLQGRVGARAGGVVYNKGGVSVEPSVTISIGKEFARDNNVTFLSGGPTGDPFTAPGKGESAFGAVSVNVDVLNSNTGMTGFVKADGKFGEDQQSVGVAAGVRTQW
jgi:outer membrane autotransporter protein